MSTEKLLISAGFVHMILKKKMFFQKSQIFEMCLVDVNKIQFFSKLTLFLRFSTTYRHSEPTLNTLNFELKIKIEKNFKSCCKTACFFSTSKIYHFPNIWRHRTKVPYMNEVSLLWDVLTYQDYTLRQFLYF